MWPHLIGFLHQVRQNFLAQQGTTWLGFVSNWIPSILSALIAATAILLLRRKQAVIYHWKQNLTIVLVATIAGNLSWYLPVLGWVAIKTIYQDHQAATVTVLRLQNKIQHLQDYATREEQYHHELKAAQAKADHWRDAYTSISKGEIIPDRTLSKDDTDRLHGKLLDIARHAGDRKYSTVSIAPEFYDDEESAHLAAQLQRVFKDSEWNVKWEFPQRKLLQPRLSASIPIGIAIYTDDPHNKGDSLVWMLKDVGLDSYVAPDTPEGFQETLICVGYKQMIKQVIP
jgi:hypothetical protein